MIDYTVYSPASQGRKGLLKDKKQGMITVNSRKDEKADICQFHLNLEEAY